VKALQRSERVAEMLDRADEDVALLERVAGRLLDAVEPEQVARLLDVVDDVVERGREFVDVRAVERGDVLRVEQLDQVVRDRVAGRLAGLDVRLGDGRVRILAETQLGPGCGLQGVRAGAGEES
jgi:hypothetical protein